VDDERADLWRSHAPALVSPPSRTAPTTLAGAWRTCHGRLKRSVATDHLDNPAYESLTLDDLLDVVAERELGWDTETETGVGLHMVSAIAVAGRIGLTAIGDTLDEARGHYNEVKAAVDAAAGVAAHAP
jgi:hypothetical protein